MSPFGPFTARPLFIISFEEGHLSFPAEMHDVFSARWEGVAAGAVEHGVRRYVLPVALPFADASQLRVDLVSAAYL